MGDHLVVGHWTHGVRQRKDVYMLLAARTRNNLSQIEEPHTLKI